jgi:adenine phosphoribosyltransferase
MAPDEIAAYITDVPDFPKPGIIYKDITPLLAHPPAFAAIAEHMVDAVAAVPLEGLLAIESRGFLFGAVLAQRLSLPLQLVRKRGKLPRRTISVAYELEYGIDHLEIHADAIRPGAAYAIVDDLLATGGTVGAVAELVRRQGGQVACCVCAVELAFLEGRARLGDMPVFSVIRY